MLAYVFWHRRADGAGREDYEASLGAFHISIAGSVVGSATFRLLGLPFAAPGGDGGGEAYEDWYLVEDWAALGALNEAAVSGARRAPHDVAAALVGDGWAGVYALARGDAVPPRVARWETKPRGSPYERFRARQDAGSVWERQMVLGPAPEFCLGAGGEDAGRVLVAGG